jgi:hypothetical protein
LSCSCSMSSMSLCRRMSKGGNSLYLVYTWNDKFTAKRISILKTTKILYFYSQTISQLIVFSSISSTWALTKCSFLRNTGTGVPYRGVKALPK